MTKHIRLAPVTAVLASLALLTAACSDSASNISAPSTSDQPGVASNFASNFAVLANAAVTCTDGNIIGNVGTYFGTPTGSITLTGCPVSGNQLVGDSVAQQAFNDFLSGYAALAPKPEDVCTMLTGTLAAATLAPGAYCFPAAATLTGLLTLDGPADGIWTFTVGSGALTGTGFSMAMAGGGQPGNVQWWVQQGVTMTDSHFIGTVLGGAAITLTRGTFDGNAYAKADLTITGTVLSGYNRF